MDRLTRLRATESLLNRNSKSSSEGRRTKEPSDPESTLRLASRKKNCVTPRSLCDTDRRGSVLRDRHAGERSKPGLTVIIIITAVTRHSNAMPWLHIETSKITLMTTSCFNTVWSKIYIQQTSVKHLYMPLVTQQMITTNWIEKTNCIKILQRMVQKYKHIKECIAHLVACTLYRVAQ